MKTKIKRLVSLLLALTMVFGCAPLSELAILNFSVFATQSKSYNFSSNYTLIGQAEKDMLAIAMAQEGKTRSDLGYTEDWCADFVCDCAKLAGESEAIPFYGGVNGLREKVLNAGGKPVPSRQKGDLIFYYCYSCARYVHVGLVLDSQYTIEGNYSGKVTKVSGGYSDEYGHSTSNGTVVKTYVRPNYTSTKILSVYYNVNGGSVSSDTYKISSNIICNKSDSTKYVHKWTYNNPKEKGLTNSGTFGLSRTGYTFVGWGTKVSGGTVFDPDDTTVRPSDLSSDIKNGSCSVTLYAQWKPNTLKVYYNANGGSISSDTYKLSSNIVCNKSDGSKWYQQWTYNSTKENGLTNSGTLGLSRPGYTFAGWGTKASGGTVYGQSDNSLVPTTLNSNIKNGDCELTLYAQWVPNTLKVYYNANGGTISSDDYKLSSNIVCNKSDGSKWYQKWTYNNTKENGLNNKGTFGLSKTGYTFVGWGTKASGGTIFDPDDATVKPSDLCADIKNGSCSVTLYAQWVPNTLTVYYNANGGALSSDKYSLNSDVVYTKADSAKYAHIWTYNTTPTNGLTNNSTFGLYRTGYTFAGWSTKASGGTIFGQNDTTLVPTDFTSAINSKNCSVTMYAQWTPNKVTLHYQSAGEVLCQSHTVTGDGKVLTTRAIERSDSSHLKYNGKTYNVTGSKTLTMTYGTAITGISIKDAGLAVSNHTGCGYIAFRDYDSKWRVVIDGEKRWCTEAEINDAVSKGTFEGYAIYSQGSTHGNIAPSGNVYFYAVWIDNHSHSYTLTHTTKATCTQKDSETYTCACGDSYIVEGKALGHNYKAIVTAPTCETGGYTTHTCSRCGDSYTDSEKNATGHNYTKSLTKSPTCTESGVYTYSCLCGNSYTEEINEKGHTYTYQVIEPTCIDNGYTYICCSDCGDSKTDNIVETKGHSFKSETIAPTCSEEGYTLKTCSVCSFSERCEEVDATGHTYGDWFTIIEPNNTYEGIKAKTCTVCSHTMLEAIPQIPFCKACPYCDTEYNDIFEYDTHIWEEEYLLDILLPSQVVISYGDSIVLHTDVGYAYTEYEGKYHIEWNIDNDCFRMSTSADEMSATFSPSKTGTSTITVKLCDEEGNVINEDTQTLTSKAGFFDKLIAFFKSMFGLTKVILQ